MGHTISWKKIRFLTRRIFRKYHSPKYQSGKKLEFSQPRNILDQNIPRDKNKNNLDQNNIWGYKAKSGQAFPPPLSVLRILVPSAVPSVHVFNTMSLSLPSLEVADRRIKNSYLQESTGFCAQRVLRYESITVLSTWGLTSVSMRYSQGEVVNTSLSRIMYCTHV